MDTNAKYAQHVVEKLDLEYNMKLLTAVGVSKEQAKQFAPRPFTALPAWVRAKFKKLANRQEVKWTKLQPREGEKAFYVTRGSLPPGPYRISPDARKAATLFEYEHKFKIRVEVALRKMGAKFDLHKSDFYIDPKTINRKTLANLHMEVLRGLDEEYSAENEL